MATWWPLGGHAMATWWMRLIVSEHSLWCRIGSDSSDFGAIGSLEKVLGFISSNWALLG